MIKEHKIIQDIKEANKKSHPKWMNATAEITSPPIKAFLTDKDKTYLRSLYDRGRYSSKSLIEVTTDSTYSEELKRRKSEKSKNEDKDLYPPIITNQESKGINEVPRWDTKPILEKLPKKEGE